MSAARTSAAIVVNSPLGALTLREYDGKLTAIDFGRTVEPDDERSTPFLLTVAQQLDAYFFCNLKHFDVALAPAGTEFEQAVWRAMLAIPPGGTRTYGDVAKQLAGSARAIGGACGRNPIPIIIPCHRIIAAHGELGGYSGRGGLTTKKFLLELEGWQPAQPAFL
ncbi:MAG: methylated-DNA--[protein]-cysteine S-methyltransferase [Alphaproteobacteria bacterium]